MAGRQRSPVRISIDSAQRVMRVRDFTTPATIYSERRFHVRSEFPVERFVVSDTSLVVFPNGLAAGPIDVTVQVRGRTRQISMSRTGQVRLSAP
jgi:hypothetical protein